MSNAKRWTKIADLTADLAANKEGLCFSVEASMMLEELVALSTDSIEVLRQLEKKIDAIIIADFSVAGEYLRSAMSDDFDYTEKRNLLDKAASFFTTSYYRLSNIEEGIQSASAANAAAYCAGIYSIEGKNKLAYDWYLRARKEFLITGDAIQKEKPQTGVDRFFNQNFVGKTISKFAILGIFIPSVGAPAFLLGAGLQYLQKNSGKYKSEVELYNELVAQIRDLAKQMYSIAESIKPNIVS